MKLESCESDINMKLILPDSRHKKVVGYMRRYFYFCGLYRSLGQASRQARNDCDIINTTYKNVCLSKFILPFIC